jgi:Domain of unknown function (DUF4112)
MRLDGEKIISQDVSRDLVLRWRRVGLALDDDRLRALEVLLDEAFVVPGTRIRFGIDGIIGIVPGIGDVLAGALSLVIPFAGWVRGIPYVTLVRMMINVAIGLLVGSIPIAGDIFDVFWKANRRNYRLLTLAVAAPGRHTWRDWVFLSLLLMGIGAVFAIPVLVVLWLVVGLANWRVGS